MVSNFSTITSASIKIPGKDRVESDPADIWCCRCRLAMPVENQSNLLNPEGFRVQMDYIWAVNTCRQHRGSKEIKTMKGPVEYRSMSHETWAPPSSLHPAHSKHTCAHQVFEQCCELFGEYRELEESWTQVRIVSVDTVFPKLLQGLSVLLLILYVSWKYTDTKEQNINITLPSNADPPFRSRICGQYQHFLQNAQF